MNKFWNIVAELGIILTFNYCFVRGDNTFANLFVSALLSNIVCLAVLGQCCFGLITGEVTFGRKSNDNE